MSAFDRFPRRAAFALTVAATFALNGCGGGSNHTTPSIPASVGQSAFTRTLGSPPSTTLGSRRAYHVLYRFKGGTDGLLPSGNLLDVHGTLYGTTTAGGGTGCGGYGCGTVFKVTTDGVEDVVYRFQGGADGASPEAGVVEVGGALYGTTYSGGGTGCLYGHGCGTVFKVTESGSETVLRRFTGGTDGARPAAGLIEVNGTLYGTTSVGGEKGGGSGCGGYGCGTVFKIATSGKKSILYDFQGGNDGAGPNALVNVGGTLYGTTVAGGPSDHGLCSRPGCGTVFKLTLSGSERVLHRFKPISNDGAAPLAGLTAIGGILYGTTSAGGGGGCRGVGCGTVFKITTSGMESVLVRFSGGSDGADPAASLANVGDTLYGTTVMRGNQQNLNCFEAICGTVFKVTTSGTKYGILHRFSSNPDGAQPYGGLIDVGGTFYGTTAGGGSDDGTVFSIQP